MESIIRLSFLIVLFTSFLAAACSKSVAPVDVSYQEHIQEGIFNFSCNVSACHDGTQQAGLELTSWETLMAAQDRLVVEPGNAEESPLVWSVEGKDNVGIPVEIMPPTLSGFPQLTRTEIRLIKDWIDQGAKNN